LGIIQVQLPDELTALIERQVAEGLVASESAFLVEAARRFAEDLADEVEIAEMVERADADLAAGRYVMVSTPEESQARHEAAMGRLRARLASDEAGN
jgi:Arc/MetJ-type ribon-helix-helix transcriptional regulator